MGRPRKAPTKPIRVRLDVADELDRRAGKRGLSISDYLADALRLPSPDPTGVRAPTEVQQPARPTANLTTRRDVTPNLKGTK